MPGNFATAYNARQLFSEWLSQGLIDREQQGKLEQFAAGLKPERELPLYLHALAGVGALIALVCFIGFLSASGLIKFDSQAGLIVWGLFFLASAIGLEKTSGDDGQTIRQSFLMQASFCFMATAKVLLVIGIALLFNRSEEWGVTVGALLVTALTYFVYRMSLDRFLSALAVLVSLFVNLLTTRMDPGVQVTLINAFFIAQLGLAALLMINARISYDYMPIAYALVASLCVEVVFFTTQTQLGYWGHHYNFSPLTINIALTAALIALIGWAAGGMDRLKSEALVVACFGALCLGAISAPGILLSAGLMVLGYARHDRLLLVSGGLLFPVFLFLYYYNLDLTLMAKSGILVGSGGVLLAGRAYMAYRGFDREA